jgi:hypothetical protein
MRTIQNLVQNEVHANVSIMISALANMPDAYEGDYADDLQSVLVQDDYEESCIQNDWTISPDRDGGFTAEQNTAQGRGRLLLTSAETAAEAWRDLAESEQIEPMQREALEHWIVSDWLADNLEEHGEMIARDLYGMTVWGRVTSGQAIFCDGVIERIYAGTCHISRRFL